MIDSPGIETHVPVALHATLEEATVTDWDIYWTNIMSAGHPWQISDDPHVHNTQEVAGYHIEGNDGPIGHVADFVINDETWTIAQLVIDTRNWWPGKQVLVPTARTENIDGPNRTVRVMLSRENIQNSPSRKGLVTECAAPAVVEGAASRRRVSREKIRQSSGSRTHRRLLQRGRPVR